METESFPLKKAEAVGNEQLNVRSETEADRADDDDNDEAIVKREGSRGSFACLTIKGDLKSSCDCCCTTKLLVAQSEPSVSICRYRANDTANMIIMMIKMRFSAHKTAGTVAHSCDLFSFSILRRCATAT